MYARKCEFGHDIAYPPHARVYVPIVSSYYHLTQIPSARPGICDGEPIGKNHPAQGTQSGYAVSIC